MGERVRNQGRPRVKFDYWSSGAVPRRSATRALRLGVLFAALTALSAAILAGSFAGAASAGRSSLCSRITQLGLDKQMNAHAAEVLASCGRAPAQSAAGFNFSSVQRLAPSPRNYGGADVNVITGGEGTYPHVTQSESQTWAQGSTVVMTYNDSRSAPSCYSGGSYSLNGGTSWVNLNARPFCSGHGTGYGDPVVVYDQAHTKWIAVFLASGCGGQGMGAWTSTDSITWSPGACAHIGGGDDRESGWVDNNPASPHYGRMYLSWNDFAQSQQIRSTYSDDGGTTWSAPVNVNSSFLRNVQVTTGPDGTVFIAAMNEGGGGLGNRTNIMYRSTNGGGSWSPVTMGAAFPGAGQSTCGYFAAMFPSYWRYMSWGDVAAGPSGVIHYVFARHGTGSDYGDVYYTRSADNGLTWSSPLKLNTDSTTRSQWMPAVAVTSAGQVFASWYDARNTSGNSYERWGRLSPDNGVSWQSDAALSDVASPLPLQPDGSVQPCYTGDYERLHANGGNFHGGWVDGRVLISGNPQQDEFYDKVDATGPPPPVPAPPVIAPPPPAPPPPPPPPEKPAAPPVVQPPPPPPAPIREPIDFEHGKARVTNIAKAKLDAVALRLRDNPRATVTIIGYSDTGSGARQETLARQRAENVKQYLIDRHGIDASRMTTKIDMTDTANRSKAVVVTILP